MRQGRGWRGESRRDDGRQMLSAIYGRFTEGFDTPDLQEARRCSGRSLWPKTAPAKGRRWPDQGMGLSGAPSAPAAGCVEPWATKASEAAGAPFSSSMAPAPQ